MNFKYFQIHKEMLQTGRTEKVDEKTGVICVISVFPFWVIIFKLSKKGHFFQFYADFSKLSKDIKAIYISERSRYALSVNGIAYYAMT